MRCSLTHSLLVCLLAGMPALAHKPEACRASADLYSPSTLHIRVKLDQVSGGYRWAAKEALKYWSTVLDMDWTVNNDPQTCNVSLAYFKQESNRLAYVVQPHTAKFDGTICVNQAGHVAAVTMSEILMHEFGHLLGLGHSRDFYSVMFWKMDSSETVWGVKLDAHDIAEVGKIHTLRLQGIPMLIAGGAK